MNTEKDLLEAFVSGFPDQYRDKEISRFVKYAIVAIREHHDFNAEYLHQHELHESTIEAYRFAFTCIKETLRLLH